MLEPLLNQIATKAMWRWDSLVATRRAAAVAHRVIALALGENILGFRALLSGHKALLTTCHPYHSRLNSGTKMSERTQKLQILKKLLRISGCCLDMTCQSEFAACGLC
jgi:hypothetical protein